MRRQKHSLHLPSIIRRQEMLANFLPTQYVTFGSWLARIFGMVLPEASTSVQAYLT